MLYIVPFLPCTWNPGVNFTLLFNVINLFFYKQTEKHISKQKWSKQYNTALNKVGCFPALVKSFLALLFTFKRLNPAVRKDQWHYIIRQQMGLVYMFSVFCTQAQRMYLRLLLIALVQLERQYLILSDNVSGRSSKSLHRWIRLKSGLKDCDWNKVFIL